MADTLRGVLHLQKAPCALKVHFSSLPTPVILIVFPMFDFFLSHEMFSEAQAPILQDFHFAVSLFNLWFCFIIGGVDT